MKTSFNILIVTHDEKLSQEVIDGLNHHYNVVHTQTEQKALEILRSSYDYEWNAILVDKELDSLDGIGFIIYLKVMLNTRHIPTLVMLNKYRPEDLEDIYEAGAFDFIKTPLDQNELLTRVKMAVRMGQHLSKITEMATKDSLTSLYNRRTLFNFFNKTFYSSRRYGKTFSFALFDLDNFKEINDEHGHIAGDIVLTSIGKVFNNSLRTADIPGRIGGEEFAVIMEETGEEEALLVCERIRQKVAALRFEFLENEAITICAGVVVFNPDSHHSISDVFRDGDTALYYSKKSGKNKATAFTSINITH